VLESLDKLGEQRAGESTALAEALEREVRALRPSSSDSPQPSLSRDQDSKPGEPTPAAPLDGQPIATQACPHCGYASKADARFCGGCGETLASGSE
jgi:hypothetical protein